MARQLQMAHEMRQSLLTTSLLLCACACAANAPDTNGDAAGGGHTQQLPDTSGGKAPIAGAGSTADTAGAAGAESTCTSGTLPADTIRLYFEAQGDVSAYSEPAGPKSFAGYVFAERVQPDRIDLVASSGQRMAIKATPKALFGGLSVGSRLWLSSYELVERDNPFAYRRAMRFTLRTDQVGPILVASMQGLHEQGDPFLGTPLSIQPLCSVSLPSHGISRENKEPCSVVEQRFEVEASTDPPVRIVPGTRVEATLGGNAYDLVLWDATNIAYPDSTCAPADWAPTVGFALDVVSRDFEKLAASAPVSLESLPLCRLGTDAPSFTLDVEDLNWDSVMNGAVESSMTPDSVTGNAIVYALPSLGSVKVETSTPEQRSVLEKGRWFSMLNWRTYLIRESQGGRILSAQLMGGPSNASTGAAPYDLLGLSLTVEAKCEWMPAACRDGDTVKATSLYDVVLGGITSQRLASHTRETVQLDGHPYDAWIAVTPDCTLTPTITSNFLAKD